MTVIEKDGFIFNFDNVLNAFVFDETDKNKPNYHGVTALKSVDIMVENDDYWYFIEIKDFHEPEQYQEEDGAKNLRQYLKYKYRDSYLYRHAEQAINKPIIYICLLVNMENALCEIMRKSLTAELPTGRGTPRWNIELAKACFVVNEDRWKKNFPSWSIRHCP